MKNELLTREILNEKWIEPSHVSVSGNLYWYNKYGETHSNGDTPAVICLNGSKLWYKNGKYHRDGDKPAIIWLNGSKSWYKNGKYIKANF